MRRRYLSHKGAVLLATEINRRLKDAHEIKAFKILELKEQVDNILPYDSFEIKLDKSHTRNGESGQVKLLPEWFYYKYDE